MIANLKPWWVRRPGPPYARRPPLVLVNGLAEQAESWYRNLPAWRERFDVHTPNLLVYDGEKLHRRIATGDSVDVDYLVGRLHLFLTSFVQADRYHLVANSLGGKVAVEFVTRYPDLVDRLVLLCPSGLSDDERLPIVEGVRRSDPRSVVGSVFHDPRHADPSLLEYYQGRFADRRWKAGLLRTVQGTKACRVRHLLPQVTRPTLAVVGAEDRIVDPRQAVEAAKLLPNGRIHVLPGCGHAPQIERAGVVNRLVAEFLTEPET
jgi:pimeloyl-ACP methyl ester carboxylesterase